MSLADKYFKEAINQILTTGWSDADFEVRPKWPDGTPAHTRKIHTYVARYDLSKEFPILTLRKQAFKTAVKEILWMWRDGSNNIKDLDAHIWDAWADENGSIGKSYGYQVGKKHQFKEGFMSQVDLLLYKLKNNPMDRRMIVTLWDNDDLKDMALAPCVFMSIWDVTDGKLNMTLIQRSGDVLAAAAPGGFDVIEYAVLQHMIAQVSGLQVGELVHIVDNLHIYDRHEELVKSVLDNPEYDAPKFWINPEVKYFYDFKEDDFKLIDYKATKSERFEVAE